MKNFFTLLAALFFCAMMSNAQTSFVATLQHEGEFTHYYGSGALRSAYNSAVTGDIITLSPGTFTAPETIEKGITLRGTGMEAAETTKISGNVSVLSEDSTYVTTFEGIIFNDKTYVSHYLDNKRKGTIKFVKCELSRIETNYYSGDNATTGPAVRLYNCVVNSVYFASYTHPDFLFYNCYVKDPYTSESDFYDTTTTFVNCVILWRTYYGNNGYSYLGNYARCHYLNFYNCIFYRSSSGSYGTYPFQGYFSSTATVYNCLSINYSDLFRSLISGGNNQTVDSVSDVFTTYQGGRNVGETFELTETAKEKYIGTDGTQIGMQGGNYPYNTTVQYPVITKFDVDAQTNKAGILNIDVEVDGK